MKKSLKEKYGDYSGSRLGGGMIGGNTPRFKRDSVQTGYTGGYSDMADNHSNWSAGRHFPVDYFEDLDEDEEEDDDILKGALALVAEIKKQDKRVEKLIEPKDVDEEDDIEEMSMGGVPGVMVPLGRNADGSHTTRRHIKNLGKKQKKWY